MIPFRVILVAIIARKIKNGQFSLQAKAGKNYVKITSCRPEPRHFSPVFSTRGRASGGAMCSALHLL